MIENFGCSSMPFTREVSVRDRFSTSFIDGEIASLKRSVESRMSALLIAPAGTGKTSILRELLNQLPKARYDASYLKVTGLSKRDMCREICRVIGAEPAGTYPSLLTSVQNRLEGSYQNDSMRPVLLLDEVHDMRPDVLSMLRIITNFDMDSKLVVSVVLVGQPSLKKKLYGPGLEDIRQRLSHCGELRLLSRTETKSYMQHRMNVVSARTFPFDEGACEAVYEITKGNMRAIDHISHKSMELGAEKKITAIDQNLITEARAKLWI